MITRRRLLQRGAIGGAGLMLSRVPFATSAAAAAATPNLSKFSEPLPIPPVLDGTGRGEELHDRGTGVDVAVPFQAAANEDLGLLGR
jgi:hypothetical protein